MLKDCELGVQFHNGICAAHTRGPEQKPKV